MDRKKQKGKKKKKDKSDKYVEFVDEEKGEHRVTPLAFASSILRSSTGKGGSKLGSQSSINKKKETQTVDTLWASDNADPDTDTCKSQNYILDGTHQVQAVPQRRAKPKAKPVTPAVPFPCPSTFSTFGKASDSDLSDVCMRSDDGGHSAPCWDASPYARPASATGSFAHSAAPLEEAIYSRPASDGPHYAQHL